MDRFTIGIAGAGSFAESFIPLFAAHPGVAEVRLAEVLPDRRREIAAKHGIATTCASLDELLASDVDAVAILTQRHLHGPQVISALEAGKHVYCAVPMASSLTEIRRIVDLVGSTRLTYMMGETSYYYPAAIYCRDRFRAGDFGDFVYGEGEYLHDMTHGFYDAFQHSGGEAWRSVAGFPPMYYPTHSTSMIVSVTGARLTHVSCMGWRDRADDGVFGDEANLWSNPFSNETALFRTSDGGMCRVNEFRRVGHGVGHSVRTSVYGTLGSFEEQGNGAIWTDLDRTMTDLRDTLACRPIDPALHEEATGGKQTDFYSGLSSVHPAERLPASFAGLPNGHHGSHQFLVDDFVRAVLQDRLAPNHAWAAARYTIPGLVAHESALKEGALIEVPDLGDAPAGWVAIGYEGW